jgi:glycerophosphoryl diester phosphodiesterase
MLNRPKIPTTWLVGSLTLVVASSVVMRAKASETNTVSPVAQLLALRRPLVIAHRGSPQWAPENTLPGFKLAKAAGADLVELDYHHTKDGVPLVIHDPNLDRTTDAVARFQTTKIPVATKTLAELRPLEAGLWFKPPYPSAKLPTLGEALDLIQDGGVTLIERKAGDAATCVELLRERNLINAVVVQAFDWEYLKDFHQQAPQQVLGALGPPYSWHGKKLKEGEKALSADWVDEVQKCGARIVIWNRQVTGDAVAFAHKRGLKVWVYTIDDPAVAAELFDLGVDGIITNNVALLWRAVALRALARD